VDSTPVVRSNSASRNPRPKIPIYRIVALPDLSPNKALNSRKLPGKHRRTWKPISVVIPAHNEADFLPATLESVWESIRFLQVEAEVIVVNDASTDDTADIARLPGCKGIDVELRNIGAVRNAGAAVAANEWLFFLDADTLLPARTLAGAIDMLGRGFAGGGAHVAIPDHPKVGWLKELMLFGVKVFWQGVAGKAAGCFMFCQKSIFDQFGGFDEKVFAAEEWFFSVQTAKRGEFGLVRFPVVTSARKLHKYSTLELMRFLTLPVLTTAPLFSTRRGLEILYDDDR